MNLAVQEISMASLKNECNIVESLNVSMGYLYLPDGKIRKYGVDTLSKVGFKCFNTYSDETMFISWPEVECKLRYLKIKPDDIFIDVGACIGSWSVYVPGLNDYFYV